MELPPAVKMLRDAVSLKIGRTAHVQKVNNDANYYVNDPVFSHVQKAARGLSTGYRVGFRMDVESNWLFIEVVHSPVMFQNFRNNVTDETLRSIVTETSPYRELQYAYWSSKSPQRDSKNGTLTLRTESLDEFLSRLPQPWDGDLVAPIPKPVSTGSRTTVKSYFILLLGEPGLTGDAQTQMKELVEAAWPLFTCFYPEKPILSRNASLARSLLAAGLLKKCEFDAIVGAKQHIAGTCEGGIQGAHIQPYIRGGSDRFMNGLWLCAFHHRATEGRLLGDRTAEKINVRLTDAPKSRD